VKWRKIFIRKLQLGTHPTDLCTTAFMVKYALMEACASAPRIVEFSY